MRPNSKQKGLKLNPPRRTGYLRRHRKPLRRENRKSEQSPNTCLYDQPPKTVSICNLSCKNFTNNGADSQPRGSRPDSGTISLRPESQKSVSANTQVSRNSLDLKSRLERLNPNTFRSGSPTSLPQSTLTPAPPLAPRGPREMPTKLPPLNVNLMPTLPPPTYSPATSLSSMLPSRSTSRPSTSRPTSSDIDRIALSQPKPSFLNDTTLTVDTLFTYLKSSQVEVLLLDVRSRKEFDEGHIHARSIVCIEPIVLREG